MIEGTICARCGEEFDYDAPLDVLINEGDRAYEISVMLGLDAPLLCEDCDPDPFNDDYH